MVLVQPFYYPQSRTRFGLRMSRNSMKLRSAKQYHDKAEQWEAEHYRRRCIDLAKQIIPELVEEHQANPLAIGKQHSLLLQRIDRLLKTYPANGRRLLPMLGHDGLWRIMELRRYEQAQLLNEPIFKTLEDLVHYLFKVRLDALKAVAGEMHDA